MKVTFYMKDNTSVVYGYAVAVNIEDYRGVKCYFVKYVPYCKTVYLKCFPFNSVKSCEIEVL